MRLPTKKLKSINDMLRASLGKGPKGSEGAAVAYRHAYVTTSPDGGCTFEAYRFDGGKVTIKTSAAVDTPLRRWPFDPAKLNAIIGAVGKDEEIAIGADGQIQAGRRKIRLPAPQIDWHPEDPPKRVPGGTFAVFHSADVAAALPYLLPAVSTDKTRDAIGGLIVDVSADRLVATDGYRLHWRDVAPCGVDASGTTCFTLDATTTALLARAVKLFGTSSVAFLLSRGQERLETTIDNGDVEVTINGQFFHPPAYERVIPQDRAWTATLDTHTLRDACEMARKLCPEDTHPKCEIKPLNAISFDLYTPWFAETVNADVQGRAHLGQLKSFGAGLQDVGLNLIYLRDALPADGRASIGNDGKGGPLQVRFDGGGAVVMPVRI